MKRITALAAALLLFMPAFSARALVNTINGQGGLAQTIANDTNVTVSSAANVHTLGWSGVLQPSRGGTGSNLSTFGSGSITFYNGTGLAQDNANLSWNDGSNILNLGGSINFASDSALTDRVIEVLDQTVNDKSGNNFHLAAGDANGGTNEDQALGGAIQITAGSADVFGTGGALSINTGAGGTTSGSGGDLNLLTGSGVGSGAGGQINITSGNGTLSGTAGGGRIQIAAGSGYSGGEIELFAGDADGGNAGSLTFAAGQGSSDEQDGSFYFLPHGLSIFNELDFSPTTSDRVFTFQDASGTLSLLEVDQIFTGLNKFEADENSTIYVGSATKSGCIALGDDDGDGITYITADDGVLSASSSKPSICQ